MPIEPRGHPPEETYYKVPGDLRKVRDFDELADLSSERLLELPCEQVEELDEDDELFNMRTLAESIKDLLPHMEPNEQSAVYTFLVDYNTKRARNNFYTFVQMMAPLILPEGFIDGAHLKLMAYEFQKVERRTYSGERDRLQLFLPPGSMKSKMGNLFVSWVFGRHPKWNILHIGHGTDFAADNFGKQIRDLMLAPEYQQIFPKTRISHKSKAAGRWETTQGGRYYAAGVGSNITGRRAHISICDDVVTEHSARSDVERPKINSWYVPGLRTRLLPNGSEIIVNTRWHMDDLSGYLVKLDAKSKIPWRVYAVPAILRSGDAKLLNYYRVNDEWLKPGKSFWPQFQPTEWILERKAVMSEHDWSALYMQSPIPQEGSIFKPRYFRIWEQREPPMVDFLIISLDTAFSEKRQADYSAYSVWGIFREKQTTASGAEHWIPNIILLECDQGRWDFPTLCAKCRELDEIWQPDSFIIENKGSGLSLIQELRNQGLPVYDFPPDKFGDKRTRANACTPIMKAGRLWVPPKEWAKDLTTQSLEFPYGAHDDLVDTMSQAIIWMRDSWQITHSDYPTERNADDEDEYIPGKGRTSYWAAARGDY
jgi:predicted phage terminase large subunit-like protein